MQRILCYLEVILLDDEMDLSIKNRYLYYVPYVSMYDIVSYRIVPYYI